MKQTLCVGELLIDFIGEKPETSIAEQISFKKKAGGAPANVAATIAALGGKCHFFGAVGSDGFGDFLANTLEKFGVDTTMLIRSEMPTTMAFVSLDQHGERDFIFARGADGDLHMTNLDSEVYQHMSCIHFGAATGFLDGALKETYSQLLINAVADGKMVSFDPNYRSAFWSSNQTGFKEAIEPFLNYANLVKLSDEEAQIITGEFDVEKASDYLSSKYEATFCITLGEKGVLIFNRLWRIKVSAPTVEVIDTTGAGDAFIGALLFKLNGDFDALKIQDKMKQYAEFANKVAADVCTEYGALTALENIITQ